MAYTEFHVTHGSAAAATNGGTLNTDNNQTYVNDGYYIQKTNCESDGVTGTTITNNDADGWGNAADGDGICFDPGGASQSWSVIKAVSGDDLTISPGVALGQVGKTVTVGGA